jgi:hypothetical protein
VLACVSVHVCVRACVRACMCVFVCFPDPLLSPARLTSCPELDTISVHIRLAGDWTGALAERCGFNCVTFKLTDRAVPKKDDVCEWMSVRSSLSFSLSLFLSFSLARSLVRYLISARSSICCSACGQSAASTSCTFSATHASSTPPMSPSHPRFAVLHTRSMCVPCVD